MEEGDRYATEVLPLLLPGEKQKNNKKIPVNIPERDSYRKAPEYK